jgi:predicted PurR-regulated permease PerM
MHRRLFKIEKSLTYWMFVVALVLDEKTPLFITLRLVAISLALIYPTLHLVSWICAKWRNLPRRAVCITVFCGVFFFIGLYGWHFYPETSYEPARLRATSPENLKATEKELSDQMRDCENKYENEVERIHWEARANHRDDTAEIRARGKDYRNEFYKEYLVKTISVNAEFLGRLNPYKPTDQDIY